MAKLLPILICWLLLGGQALAAEKRYVSADVLNVRLCPAKGCPITNRIYRQQVVEVFEVRGDWARISQYYDAATERPHALKREEEQVARWVAVAHLVSERPGEVKQPEPDSSLSDPRLKGIPKVGEFGLSETDVVLLRKFGKQLLASGECDAIDIGDKSVSRSGTYYVHCVGETRNRFFTTADAE